MKLRNKKTGDIGELSVWYRADNKEIKEFGVIKENEKFPTDYKSLAELTEEWEDYEEPKDNSYWYIDDFGRIRFSSEVLDEIEEHPNNWMARKLFGNYFETREEAEKAVEKLKAWKRLKDKGFRFEGIKQDYTRFFNQQKPIRTGRKYLQFNKAEDEEWLKENGEDLDLLFGDEE